jgi:eukaryotic-like serine/threonine-protein kinase
VSTQRTIGRYEIQAELGRGAMGVVYRAHDPLLSRTVAIKTINMDLEQDGMEEYEARFYMEAKAAGGLNHANIVIVYDIGKTGNLAYMAMEYIDGVELRTMLSQGQPLPVPQSLDVAAQVAEGLAYAHEHHVVHRDIKPANILITPQGRAKIADFGIARMRSAETQTQTGVILGSPKYLSPEQVVGKRADHRSDVFSLGVILYQCLTGNTPFNGDGVSALMYQITNHNPAPPSTLNPQVPVMLDYIVAKALAKSVDERYQSCSDLAGDLRECRKTLEPPMESSNPRLSASGSNPSLSMPLAATQTVALDRPQPGKAKDTVASLEAETLTAAPAEPVPTRGLSRAFDSTEATQRLLAQTLDPQNEVAPQQDPESTGEPVVAPGPFRRPAHPWGDRENKILAATVMVALALAAWIISA